MSNYHDNWKPGDEIERLHIMLKTAEEIGEIRLKDIERLRDELADALKNESHYAKEIIKKDKRIEELEENIRTVVEDPYYLRFLGNALKEKNNADAT